MWEVTVFFLIQLKIESCFTMITHFSKLVLLKCVQLCNPIWKRNTRNLYKKRNFPLPWFYVSYIVCFMYSIWFTLESGHFCILFMQDNKRNYIRIMLKLYMLKIRKAHVNLFSIHVSYTFFLYCLFKDINFTYMNKYHYM